MSYERMFIDENEGDATILSLRAQIDNLRAEIERLRADNATLRAELAEAQHDFNERGENHE